MTVDAPVVMAGAITGDTDGAVSQQGKKARALIIKVSGSLEIRNIQSNQGYFANLTVDVPLEVILPAEETTATFTSVATVADLIAPVCGGYLGGGSGDVVQIEITTTYFFQNAAGVACNSTRQQPRAFTCP